MTSKAGANWLEVLKPGDSSFEKAWDSLCARQVAQPTDAQIADVVERMSHVRAGGDRALRGWTRSVRGLELDRFELIQEEWNQDAFVAWLEGHARVESVAAPVGRRIKAAPPASPEALVSQLGLVDISNGHQALASHCGQLSFRGCLVLLLEKADSGGTP